ncbi:hypothetical protein SNEBB_010789 [Seison nebaliae]|nr:hypothetical protein SNEBB_010789 [Seison nebaliae]
MVVRRATHAGSWYVDNPVELKKQIDTFIRNAKISQRNIKTKAIIGPHAGYSYSGSNAGHVYRSLLQNDTVQTIFLLGPSHHVSFDGCGVSVCEEYETPFGNIKLNQMIADELVNENKKSSVKTFQKLTRKIEEDEHSLEMHLPFIKYIMSNRPETWKLVPIMVGHTNQMHHEAIGNILIRYFMDPQTVFIISSDFCHWGSKFNYIERNNSLPISESIKELDMEGIKFIVNLDYEGFVNYLKRTSNTICGRNPIMIFLFIINKLRKEGYDQFELKLQKYNQSNQAQNIHDCSVSYASLTLTT